MHPLNQSPSSAIKTTKHSKVSDTGHDNEICFAVSLCALGTVLAARNRHGICAISLGDDQDTLVHDLQEMFPKASLHDSGAELRPLMSQLVAFIDAPTPECHLTLDVHGTAFQERVWQELSKIPPGATASYTEIAERIGLPKSVRAVANACGANRLAVVIPCHRIVRRDGSITGYRWGTERKRDLLQREKTPRP